MKHQIQCQDEKLCEAYAPLRRGAANARHDEHCLQCDLDHNDADRHQADAGVHRVAVVYKVMH